MQVDKNCNATGATTQNIQLTGNGGGDGIVSSSVGVGGIGKHEIDGKHKDIILTQMKNKHQSLQAQSTPAMGNSENQLHAAPITATSAISTPIGQTQSTNLAEHIQGATFINDSVQQQQHNVINKMLTNIVNQSNIKTAIGGNQKGGSGNGSDLQQIPTSRSRCESPHKNNTGNSNQIGMGHHYHGKHHQQNNSTSFPTQPSKIDGKNVVRIS